MTERLRFPRDPGICLWCRNGSLLDGMEEITDQVACCQFENIKAFKKGARSGRPKRVYLKLMDSDETCEHWAPIRDGARRRRLCEMLGVSDGQVD